MTISDQIDALLDIAAVTDWLLRLFFLSVWTLIIIGATVLIVTALDRIQTELFTDFKNRGCIPRCLSAEYCF